jgi:hypothetical protein
MDRLVRNIGNLPSTGEVQCMSGRQMHQDHAILKTAPTFRTLSRGGHQVQDKQAEGHSRVSKKWDFARRYADTPPRSLESDLPELR